MRLNLGCGYVTPHDWVNVDIKPASRSVVKADVLKGLPFTDNYFDYVLMNCTLQVFTYDELPRVLAEVKRVMSKGSILRILTPNIDQVIDAYQRGDERYFPISNLLEPTLGGKFARYLFWHGESRSAFNYEALEDLLKRHGFWSVKQAEYGECELDSRPDECMVVEASK